MMASATTAPMILPRFFLTCSPPSLLAVDLTQRLEQLLVVGQLVDVVDVHETNDPFLVHNERSSLGEPLLAQNAVSLGHLAVWPEVAEQQDAPDLQRLSPRGVGSCAVHAYAQDLGIFPLEPLDVGIQRGNLNGSDGRPS